MTVVVATEPGDPDRANEDWAGTADGVAVVLDGVSAPGGTRCRHGVAWYSQQLGSALLDRARDRSRGLVDALRGAITHVATLHPGCGLDYRGTPAAAVGIVRRNGPRLDWLVLADVTVVLRRPAGDVEVVSDERVDDALDPALRDAALAAPLHSHEQQQAVTRMSTDQLHRRNVPGGYWVAAADSAAADQALTGHADLADLHDVAVVSDGVERLVTMYRQTTWAGLLDQLQHGGPQRLIDRVRALEDTDPDGRRWPRFKPRDDAAAAYARCDTPNPIQRHGGGEGRSSL